MKVDLSGKVVLVTGASSGIGRSIAAVLATSGARVAVHYFRNEVGAAETLEVVRRAQPEAWLVRGDLAKAGEGERLVRDVVDTAGKIDILVNNAGDPVAVQGVGTWQSEYLDYIWAVNLRSVIECSQAAVQYMKAAGGGRIVNISSVGALEGGSAGTLPYAAAKGGVETFTRGLAREVGVDGITVNAIAPGSIKTAMQDRFLTSQQVSRTELKTAVGKCGTPDDIAAAVLFLVSTEASFITGQVMRVDGGRSA